MSGRFEYDRPSKLVMGLEAKQQAMKGCGGAWRGVARSISHAPSPADPITTSLELFV